MALFLYRLEREEARPPPVSAFLVFFHPCSSNARSPGNYSQLDKRPRPDPPPPCVLPTKTSLWGPLFAGPPPYAGVGP